jgi:arabinofuranosyltransferase
MRQLNRTDVLVLAAALIIAVTGRLYVGVLTSDDAYITFRYAANLAAHHQLVFNLGERVLGTSTPLFALVLSAAAAIHLPLERSAFALAVASDLATISLVFLLLVSAGERVAARVAVAPLAALPAFLTSVASGMEAPVYTLLILLSVYALARAEAEGSWVMSGTLLGLTALCRPEGGMLAVVALAGLAWRRRWALAVRIGVIAIITIAPWLLIAAWYYGSPVPQSLVTKAANEPGSLDGVRTLRQYLLSGYYIPLTALAIVGVHSLWNRGLTSWRILISWWGVYAATFALTGAFARAEWYFTPLLPVYLAAVSTGVVRLLDVPAWKGARGPAAILFAVALTAMGCRHWERQRAALTHVREIREWRYMAIADDISRSARPCNVAAPEIGAIGFRFPGRIIDLGGLVTPGAVRRTPQAMLRDEGAQWLVIHNIFTPASLLADPWFKTSFREVSSTWLEPGRTVNVYQRVEGVCSELPR